MRSNGEALAARLRDLQETETPPVSPALSLAGRSEGVRISHAATPPSPARGVRPGLSNSSASWVAGESAPSAARERGAAAARSRAAERSWGAAPAQAQPNAAAGRDMAKQRVRARRRQEKEDEQRRTEKEVGAREAHKLQRRRSVEQARAERERERDAMMVRRRGTGRLQAQSQVQAQPLQPPLQQQQQVPMSWQQARPSQHAAARGALVQHDQERSQQYHQPGAADKVEGEAVAEVDGDFDFDAPRAAPRVHVSRRGSITISMQPSAEGDGTGVAPSGSSAPPARAFASNSSSDRVQMLLKVCCLRSRSCSPACAFSARTCCHRSVRTTSPLPYLPPPLPPPLCIYPHLPPPPPLLSTCSGAVSCKRCSKSTNRARELAYDPTY